MAQKLRPQRPSLYGSPGPLYNQSAPPVISVRSPTADDTGYPLGQMWVNKTSDLIYLLTSVSGGQAAWGLSTAGSGDVAFLNADSGQATPSNGEITIAGGSNITTSASSDTLTVSLDNEVDITGPIGATGLEVTGQGGYLRARQNFADGFVEVASINTATTGPDSSAYFLSNVGGPNAGDSFFSVNVEGEQSFVWGIDNSTTNDDFVITEGAFPGDGPSLLSFDGSSFDATFGGNVTVPSGNFFAVNGGAVTDFIGIATLSSGTVTVANTNIAATDRIFLSYLGTGIADSGNLSFTISAGASFTIESTNGSDANTVAYFIVRQV